MRRQIARLNRRSGEDSGPLESQSQPRLQPATIYRPTIDEPDNEGILSYWNTLYRHKATIFGIAALGALCGYLATLPQLPAYRAAVSLEVLELNSSFLNIQELSPNSNSFSAETRLNTEMKMLESKSLLRTVAEKLNASDLPRPRREQDGLSVWLQSIGLPPLRERPTLASAVAMAANTLKVRNPEMTRVVEISCESTDPDVAADFVNTLTDTYMGQTVEGRLNNTLRTRDWLDRQIEEIKVKLQILEGQLVQHAQSSGLLTTEAADTLQRMNEEMARVRVELLGRQADLQIATTRPPEAIPQIARDDMVKIYGQRLIEKRNELGQLATTYGPEHYRIRRVKEEIADLEGRLRKEQSDVIGRIGNEYEAAKLRQQIHLREYEREAAKVADQSKSMIQYNMLKREVDTHRQLYDSMLQKVKEAGLASAVRASNVRVVDPAEAPKSPFRPNPAKSTLTGLATGIFVAVVFVFARLHSDRRLRSPGEASVHLQVPELGAIPSAPALAGIRRGRMPLPWIAKTSDLPGAAGSHSESFRSLLVSLLPHGAGERVLLVTSPNAQEGKTTIISNLAIVLAEIGRRVLVIDTDLRRPRLHEVFDVPNTWGVSDLLSGDTPVSQCPAEALSRPTKVPGLNVLPSGPGTANIAKLLYSEAMEALLARVRKEFDVILIDTPPMLEFPDARILGPRVDGVVLVFRAWRTDRDVARSAVTRLVEDGVPVLGVVLNDWDPKKAPVNHYGSAYAN